MQDFDEPMILFSVQDMFGYLRAHSTMSGIQRVQAGIALYAIDHEPADVGFILNELGPEHRDGEFLLVENGALRDIILYASGDRVDHDVLRRMLGGCEADAKRLRPGKGDIIILLGAFWGHGNTIDRYVKSKRDGVTIGAYVYDIIPVTHPEFCQEDLPRHFSTALAELTVVVDFILTISEYTRTTLTALFDGNVGRNIPMEAVPLAHSLTGASAGPGTVPAALRKLNSRPYVAYVSTIEARKNHLYVINAWREMIAQGIDVPDLVFVGRQGWRVGGLNDLLDGTRNLGGRVHILHDLTDAEIDAVYANCLFTVFPSFVEGWGLPVGESLVHHVPCVASGTSSIPEVGGEFVDYVDPLNLREGVETFSKLILDPVYRQSRRRHIEDAFVPRTWSEVGQSFLTRTRVAQKAGFSARACHPPLAEGVRFAPGELVTEPIRMTQYLRSPMGIALVESFYALEPRGVWMKGATGQLAFQTALAAGEEIIVYLELSVPTGGSGARLGVRLLGAGENPHVEPSWHRLDEDRRNLVRVAGTIGPDGICTLAIELSGTLPDVPNDGRKYGVGLVAIGYVRAHERELREDLVERFTFRDLTVGG